jgi:hypothetical protein
MGSTISRTYTGGETYIKVLINGCQTLNPNGCRAVFASLASKH